MPPDSGIEFAVTEGGITLEATGADIHDLVLVVASHAGIFVPRVPDFDQRMTLSLQDVTVPEAIARILRGQSFVLAYREPWGGPPEDSPNRLWLLSAGVTAAFDPGTVDGDAPVRPGRAPVTLDPAVREEALFALGESRAPGTTTLLIQALGDDSPDVRAAAIVELAGTTEPGVIDALTAALADPDAGVREEAVFALGGFGPDARGSIESAASDTDAGVRRAALDVLSDLR